MSANGWRDGRLKVEHILNRPLRSANQIHHIDGNSQNNSNSNLVVCEDQEYHHLIHMRARALKECGHKDWKRCTYCKTWDAPDNLYIGAKYAHHKECVNAYEKQRLRNNREVLIWL